MGEILKSLREPEVYQEVSVHPVTKKRGRFALRRGKPIQKFDGKRMRWVQHVDVEELPPEPDNSIVFVICDGGMGLKDFPEISAELAESRRRRKHPMIAPKAEYIKEACTEIRLKGTDSYRVGNQTFTRPSKGLLIPRNAAWAQAMAEESRRF